MTSSLLPVVIVHAMAVYAGPKVILTVIVDDMGWYDSQPHNPLSPTPNLGSLAKEGLTLDRHYTYTYCSPTRRSFVTGRFPVYVCAPCIIYVGLQTLEDTYVEGMFLSMWWILYP